MKSKTCCFTGHRKIPENKMKCLLANLQVEIENLIRQGVTTFISGGALGFDTIAASMVITLKESKYPYIKLIFALPCREQSKYWNIKEIQLYDSLLEDADEVIYVSEDYYRGCMQTRNCYMVDNSDFCIAYLTKNRSGTAFTVRYAKCKEIHIINAVYY